MIGLFHLNNRMEIFPETEKTSYHSKHARDHTFMTSPWKGDSLGWSKLFFYRGNKTGHCL